MPYAVGPAERPPSDAHACPHLRDLRCYCPPLLPPLLPPLPLLATFRRPYLAFAVALTWSLANSGLGPSKQLLLLARAMRGTVSLGVF